MLLDSLAGFLVLGHYWTEGGWKGNPQFKTKFLKNISKKELFFFGISYSMGYLPNSEELQGMNDIEEG